MDDTKTYRVSGKVEEVPGVMTLQLVDMDGTVPSFTPGQYINVYFPECNTPEGKAYSISCEPLLPTFSITVRGIGEFSNKLCAMNIGDTIIGSLPYGFFYPENEESELVFIAAGIGITPFKSIIGDIAKRSPNRSVSLFHSIRTMEDAIFHDSFKELQKKLPNFSIVHFVTREPAFGDSIIPHRITAKEICEQATVTSTTEFLICGSISFVRDIWRDLRDNGVSEDNIYTEAFFSH